MSKTALSGLTVLVAGGVHGLAAEIAEAVGAAGAVVVVADDREDAGAALADRLRRRGSRATYVHLDVADPLSWEAAVFETIAATDRFDVLIDASGVIDPGAPETRAARDARRMRAAAAARFGAQQARHAMRAEGPAGRGGVVIDLGETDEAGGGVLRRLSAILREGADDAPGAVRFARLAATGASRPPTRAASAAPSPAFA